MEPESVIIKTRYSYSFCRIHRCAPSSSPSPPALPLSQANDGDALPQKNNRTHRLVNKKRPFTRAASLPLPTATTTTAPPIVAACRPLSHDQRPRFRARQHLFPPRPQQLGDCAVSLHGRRLRGGPCAVGARRRAGTCLASLFLHWIFVTICPPGHANAVEIRWQRVGRGKYNGASRTEFM